MRIAIWLAGLFLIYTIGIGSARAAGPDDDWEEVAPAPSAPQQSAPASRNAQTVSGSAQQRSPAASARPALQKRFTACGEAARPAQEPYRSIVASLNQMWGTHAKIYESVEPTTPHASPGGCIFYNSQSLQALTGNWMGITDADQLSPMLYAINAHELGHIMHGDLTPARANVPLETKELEADRFAGYTLWRLNVKRFDAADTERYYQAVGDDFVGAQGSHGTGAQRIKAFQDGWDLARTGGRETASRPLGGE